MASCFRYLDSVKNVVSTSAHDKPCGSSNNASEIFPCCQPEDECMENGICHYSHSLPGGSGYYLASCTDPTYKDPACPQNCGDQPIPDVTYSNSDSLWACCGADTVGGALQPQCPNPTNETFSAPQPSQLIAFSSALVSATISSAIASTTISSGTTIASSSPQTTGGTGTTAPTSSAASDSSSGLSSGVVAGIAVACTIIGLITLIGLGFLIWRAKRQRQAEQSMQTAEQGAYDPKNYTGDAAGAYDGTANGYYSEKRDPRLYPYTHHFMSELPHERSPGDTATGGAVMAELEMDRGRAELSPEAGTGENPSSFMQELDGAEVASPRTPKRSHSPIEQVVSPQSPQEPHSPRSPCTPRSPRSPMTEISPLSPL